VLWFALLEHARRVSDLALARRARRELTRLGIRVAYSGEREASPPVTETDIAWIADRVVDLLRSRDGDGGR
jgi:hypothetical protein